MKSPLMNFTKIIILGCMLILCPDAKSATMESIDPAEPAIANAEGGVIEGNGGEHITNEENPWFLGSKPVSYCIKYDSFTFSVNLDQARSAIKDALQTWQKFIKDRDPNRLGPPFLLAKNGNLGLSLEFNEVPCEQEHELDFQFGVKDAYLDKALEYSAKNIIALSFREAYSDVTGRAKGRIWLSADLGDLAYSGPNPGPGFWAKKYYLVNALTHELGHVFGFRHTESGLMAVDFPAKMLDLGLDAQVTRDSIGNDFFMCGKITQKQNLPNRENPFLKIFGLDIDTIDHICFEKAVPSKTYSHNPFIHDMGAYKLFVRIKDGSSRVFDGSMDTTHGTNLTLRGQFLVPDQGQGQGSHYSNFSFMTFRGPYNGQGTLKTPQGNLFMTVNSVHPSTLWFSLGYDGAWHDFFVAKYTPEVVGMLFLEESGYKATP